MTESGEGSNTTIHGDSVGGDKLGGDKITVGNISGSYAAIGNGAHVIVEHIQQALSVVDEMGKGIQTAERRLANAIWEKVAYYAGLPTRLSEEEQRNPYRALLNYRIEDAPFFYGRKEAIEAMIGRTNRDRLTILHADSGSGKTSLLQAGLASRLLAAEQLPLYIRPYRLPPNVAIKRAFLPDYATLGELARFRDDNMSLRGFLKRVTEYLGQRKLLILLDQFEEFFVELGTQQQEKFAEELQECIESDLDVGWVLSLRKEYFSDLRLFSALRPYENQFFLSAFNSAEAREVMVEPAALKGVSYEDSVEKGQLVDRILEDLGQADGVPPAQVQLVCYTLFEEHLGETDQHQITHNQYEKPRGRGGQRGAAGILTNHLQRTLDDMMSSAQRKIAISVLTALVTPDNRRDIKSYSRLSAELQQVDAGMLDDVIEMLVNSRLLRTDEDENDEYTYELAHDYLLQEIEIDPATQARKLAQEILNQEVLAWEINPDLRIPQDKLAMLKDQEASLIVDEDGQRLLEISRIAVRNRRLRNIGALILATIVIAVVSTLALTGQLNRLIYRPLANEMIEIPTGMFLMGSSDEDIKIAEAIEETDLPENAFYRLGNEQPKHALFVDGFHIDRLEVTNKEYLQCTRATVCSPPHNSFYAESDFQDWPVTHVNWEQANIYCEWTGGRLPTEAEWEKAARYGNGLADQIYAWGNTREDERANVFIGIAGSPLPVGTYSPLGDTAGTLADMTGNVWEWVADWYAEDYYQTTPDTNPAGPEDGLRRIVRGGSYDNDWVQARISYRNFDFRTGDSAPHLGFRCAR